MQTGDAPSRIESLKRFAASPRQRLAMREVRLELFACGGPRPLADRHLANEVGRDTGSLDGTRRLPHFANDSLSLNPVNGLSDWCRARHDSACGPRTPISQCSPKMSPENCVIRWGYRGFCSCGPAIAPVLAFPCHISTFQIWKPGQDRAPDARRLASPRARRGCSGFERAAEDPLGARE